MVKEYLSNKGVKFEERDVSRHPSAAQELVRTSGQMGVPVTVINEEIIIGFDRSRLEQVLEQYLKEQRPLFGASVADAGKITERQGDRITYGAYVGKVRTGSVAERIGLIPGDIIIELNLQRITNADELDQVIANLNRGSRISVTLVRDNKEIIRDGVL